MSIKIFSKSAVVLIALVVITGCAGPTTYNFQETVAVVETARNCNASDYVCGVWKVRAKGEAEWDLAIVPAANDSEFAYHGVLLRVSENMDMFDIGEVMVKIQSGDRIHEGVQLWKNLAGRSVGYRKATFTFTTESAFLQDNQMVLGFSVIGTEWNAERINDYQ